MARPRRWLWPALVALALAGALGIQYQRVARVREARLRPEVREIVREPVPARPESAPFYTIEDLGVLPGYDNSFAWGINAAGQVVGALWALGVVDPSTAYTEIRSSRAFLWTEGRMEEFGALLGESSNAVDVNASGQVVGNSDSQPFLWVEGTMTDLLREPGRPGRAAAINDAGQIVGTLHLGNGHSQAVLWEKGRVRRLGTLGGSSSGAADINNRGVVVGSSAIAASGPERRPFLWDQGTMLNLGSLGGSASVASAINDAGVVVGVSQTSGDSTRRAWRWSAGILQDLGTLPGSQESQATGINAAGQIVGFCTGAAGGAFLYTDAAGMVDLNTRIDRRLGWELHRANAINDAGQIAGNGSHRGKSRAFRLTPVEAGR